MKKYFSLVLFMGIINSKILAQNRMRYEDPCQIFGTAYVETDRQRATYFVYIETEDDYSADLRVFKEYNQLYADKSGYWFLSKTKAFADFSIFLVPHRSEADFTIFYVEDEIDAGCD